MPSRKDSSRVPVCRHRRSFAAPYSSKPSPRPSPAPQTNSSGKAKVTVCTVPKPISPPPRTKPAATMTLPRPSTVSRSQVQAAHSAPVPEALKEHSQHPFLAAEDLIHVNRHERRLRHDHRADQSREQQERADRSEAGGILNPFAQRLPRPRRAWAAPVSDASESAKVPPARPHS